MLKRVWQRHNAGWTLAEMALVVGVLGILAAMVLPTLTAASRQARSQALRSTLSHLQDTSDRYAAVNAAYPTTSQPGPCPDAFTFDFSARGIDGTALIPGLLRFPPQTVAQELGLDPGLGTTVYYGVGSQGKVFATQAPPAANGEWTDGGTVVYTQESAPQFTTLAGICGNGTGGAAGSTLVLTLSTGQQEIAMGGAIAVTASVTSGGTGMPGRTVLITASGSVTGSQTYSCTTDSSGLCSVNVTSSTPQYMVLSAIVS